MRRSGQAMAYWALNMCFMFMFWLVFATFHMQVHAATDDRKHVRRELVDEIPGFISIDCGLPVDSSGYIDQRTGIFYTSDEGFAEEGESKRITTELSPAIDTYLQNVRSFPKFGRNCYTLKPKAGKNNTYLIRATFLYGNYDSRNSPPAFDLYLGTNLWDSLNFTDDREIVRKEIIYIPTTDYIDICLINQSSIGVPFKGVPFISALELRLLNNDIYKTESGSSLEIWERYDYGNADNTSQPIRYKNDDYDRFWDPMSPADIATVETPLPMDSLSNNAYRLPPLILRTAVTPTHTNGSLVVNWKPPNPNSGYYIYMHFFEVNSTIDVPRKFTIDLDIVGMFPSELQNLSSDVPLTLSASGALKGVELNLKIRPSNESTLPPILNAVEIYIKKDLRLRPTRQVDVDAMMNIKNSYKVNSNWQGDPCLPKNYTWVGVKCDYNHDMPIIDFLNLSLSGLKEEIIPAFANLTKLKTLDLTHNNLSGAIPEFLGKLTSLKLLDLSHNSLSGTIPEFVAKLTSLKQLDLSLNSLSGTIPEFLADMPSLEILNLAGNKLTGSVPQALLSRNGSTLTLSVGDNPDLCVSECQKKKKKSNKKSIVAASVISLLVLVLSVGAFVFWKCRRKRSQEMTVDSTKEVPLASKRQSFSYLEIARITNNFKRRLGKGATGEVYHGYLEDQTQVAVKILFPSFTESSRNFQTEVQLLLRIHHKNLVSFLGYCNDGTNMALLYEYMANGSLKEHLSEKNANVLTWKERLQIAVDTAQGLEYLHNGCKPSVVHRDLKPDNILLNENLRAKICDFGISAIFEAESRTHITADNVAGTFGYFDPEYFRTKKLSEKSDVYSFGVVLLELITGQPNQIKDTEVTNEFTHISYWVEPSFEKRDIQKIIDSRLQGNFGIDSATMAVELAMACVPEYARQRPDMAYVLAKLKECLALESADDRALMWDTDDTGTNCSLEHAFLDGHSNASVRPNTPISHVSLSKHFL
ncbi:Leucine-rich repeat receptor-like serine/threonine-protein kinase [Actinidia chinensis var. chinensis]|uniref:non-specific serine/threonine protein kinase n=1 Tax=Actinidia chinensis var. chinensis TaxID=1590841 RepID=A0A2R6QFQ7_ACTCC|nr:Leucine-rich repeat receptor-like serine/threonine-protein kinase [Actinidia chinensis var. chinensis]